MTDIRKFAVTPTTQLHLRDANDEPMFADSADGQPDATRPLVAVLYGPGSKAFKKAQAAASNRTIDRLKKKGKSDLTADEQARENAEFLAACTVELQNVELDGLREEALALAVYTMPELGFIAEQVNKHINDWANFSQQSAIK
jgi:hypothetical protein